LYIAYYGLNDRAAHTTGAAENCCIAVENKTFGVGRAAKAIIDTFALVEGGITTG
jgi:hypothetical protein